MQNNLFILFGATGDLSREKLFKALLAYYRKNKGNITVLAVSRRPYTDVDFRNFIQEYVDGAERDEFLENVFYVSGTFEQKETYQKVKEFITNHSFENISAYLAVSPTYFETIIDHGFEAGLWKTDAHTHVLIEKPYAHTVAEFESLMKTVDRCLRDNAFLVDHYLAKAPMLDIGSFLKGQNIGESKGLRNIEITLFENNDVEKRGSYYDVVGAFIDVGANHMLQMLASVFALDENSTQRKLQKVELLESLLIDAGRSEKFQYEGYRDIENVAPDSRTETAFKIYLTSSHPLLKNTEIVLVGGKGFDRYENTLTMTGVNGEQLVMSLKPEQYLSYGDVKKTYEHVPDAYEVLVEKSFTEDSMCFVTRDEVRAEWRIIRDLQDAWLKKEPESYTKNTKPFI